MCVCVCVRACVCVHVCVGMCAACCSLIYVYNLCSYYYDGNPVICDTYCDVSEDELTDCVLTKCDSFYNCYNGVVGITFSK